MFVSLRYAYDGRVSEKVAPVGAEGYLAKPFALDMLLAEVARFTHG